MLKLILADNQAIFRAGIAKVLAVEDEMRIVAQAQTPEQMFMALDKFRAAVLIVAGGFQSDFNAMVQGATKNKTRVVVLADTGESAQRYMSNGAHGVVYRNVTSPALVDCVRKVARGETWVQDVAVPSELTENDMVGLRVRDRLTAKELRIVQEQGDRLAIGNHRTGDQKLPAQCLRQDWRVGSAGACALHHPSPHPERSGRGDGGHKPAAGWSWCNFIDQNLAAKN
jgi:DNA-binding NarL/FixJ family response regulator